MFHYINGIVGMAEPNMVVLDVHGVGYAISTSLTSSAGLKVGDTAKFFTYLNVKEDIFELYGFSSGEELSFFKQLLSISGVGAKAAVSILSVAEPSRLALAIISGDEKLITQANGIGKKIAQRVILELRDKIAKDKTGLTVGDFGDIAMPKAQGAAEDALAALEVLGYPKSVVLQALGGADLSTQSTEEIIRLALKRLM